MDATNFTYWLQGAIELGRITEFDSHQVQVIQDHLGLVIKKVTPQYSIQSPPNLTMPVIGKPFDLSNTVITC